MATSTSPSLFDKLPVELIRRIVTLVGEQDEVFDDSELERASSMDVDVDVAVPLECLWSPWCGRGLAAVSSVNKQLRQLALPGLLETVTVKQLAKPFFRYKLIDRVDVCSAIQHLDIRLASEADLLAAAPQLRRLNFPRLTVGPSPAFVALLLNNPVEESESACAKEAYGGVLRSARRVVITGQSQPVVRSLLDLLDAENLCHLGIAGHGSFPFADPDDRLRDRLNQLVRLKSLHLDSWPSRALKVDAYWLKHLRLPSVSSVTVSSVGTACEAVLELLQKVTPNVTSLRLLGVDQYYVPSCTFASLRHLLITVPTADDVNLLDAFASCPSLISITYEPSVLADIGCYNSLPSPVELAPSLRYLRIRYESGGRPDDVEHYAAACRKRGIAFSFSWQPDLHAMGPTLTENGYGASFHAREWGTAAGARELLDWARRRLDQAERMRDPRTAEEVVQALGSIAELYHLEMQ